MLKEFFLLALVAFSASQALLTDRRPADLDLLQKQKKIYELFLFIDQAKIIGTEFYETGINFDIERNIDLFDDKLIIKEFLYLYRLGLLKRDALFSPIIEEHRQELILIFKLLLSAKDFTTFYKIACWGRIHLNGGLLLTALNTALLLREDCKGIIIPPISEIYPNLFIDNKIIIKAQKIKSLSGIKSLGGDYSDELILNISNLTHIDSLCLGNEDCLLSYFTHDIELNNLYYDLRNLLPFWLPIKELKLIKDIPRGELYLHIHQQLLARYKLERLSLGLGPIEELDIHSKILPGFQSNLIYPNGIALPSRILGSNILLSKPKLIKELLSIEHRILDAIDSGLILTTSGKLIDLYTSEGLDLLGNLLEGNIQSCNIRLYGSLEILYRNILGLNLGCLNKNCLIPSALQTYTISLRDPLFWRLSKIITNFLLRYKCNLPSYTRQDLELNGILLQDIKIGKLITYMDKCDYNINNALPIKSLNEGLKLNIKARQLCLNHKPFNYNLIIKSDRKIKSLARIFLGPGIDLCQNDHECLLKHSQDFILLDKFIIDLLPGINKINRLSTDCLDCLKNPITSDILIPKLRKALEGTEPLILPEKSAGLPSRLYLPRGRIGGLNLKLFIILSPIDESQIRILDLPKFGKLILDGKPLGFPLDRPLLPLLLNLKNLLLKDISIHHIKDPEELQLLIENEQKILHENLLDEHLERHGLLEDNIRDRLAL